MLLNLKFLRLQNSIETGSLLMVITLIILYIALNVLVVVFVLEILPARGRRAVRTEDTPYTANKKRAG